MQKFSYKLEALLKVREFKEKALKVELGNILKEIQSAKDKIFELENNVATAYDSQESMLKNDTSGNFLRFYPAYIKAQKDHVIVMENKIFSLQKKYDLKVEELKFAMADVKVIEKLKEKELLEHKRLVAKKEQENTEELFMMRRSELIL